MRFGVSSKSEFILKLFQPSGNSLHIYVLKIMSSTCLLVNTFSQWMCTAHASSFSGTPWFTFIQFHKFTPGGWPTQSQCLTPGCRSAPQDAMGVEIFPVAVVEGEGSGAGHQSFALLSIFSWLIVDLRRASHTPVEPFSCSLDLTWNVKHYIPMSVIISWKIPFGPRN